MLKDVLGAALAAVVDVESGRGNLENYFLDGTQIEANANKFSFVWKKSTKLHCECLREQAKLLPALPAEGP